MEKLKEKVKDLENHIINCRLRLNNRLEFNLNDTEISKYEESVSWSYKKIALLIEETAETLKVSYNDIVSEVFKDDIKKLNSYKR